MAAQRMETKVAGSFEKDIERVNQIPAVANILEVICMTTGMGFAAVARVTKERWIACAVADKIGFGLKPGGELEVQTTLCNEVMQAEQIIAIDHVAEDPVYANHHTPRIYGLQSYISVPLMLRNGDFFGTLCAIDPNPAEVNNPKIINSFKLFSELISFHLDSLKALSDSEALVASQQEDAEFREHFIAILGHDLRNPVNAIHNAVQLQLRSELDERNKKLASIIHNSTKRTKELIENMLDFASGRLGGGIKLHYNSGLTLSEALNQVVTELRIAFPESKIDASFEHTGEIMADYDRLSQLFSNLLANAITHGEKGSPITVTTTTNDKIFELCVANKGEQISEEAKKHLFKPFSRGKVHNGQEGLGLGLYIVSEIANAHGGEVRVESTEERTCFMVSIPLANNQTIK